MVRIQSIDSYLQSEHPNDIVRLIYFVPNDRLAQEDMDTRIDIMIKEVQQFYADQMFHHGYGHKTFAFESDDEGKAIVHHIRGKFDEAHYNSQKIEEEVGEHFNLSRNIYFITIEGDPKVIRLCGLGGFKRGGISGTTFISSLKPPCLLSICCRTRTGSYFRITT